MHESNPASLKDVASELNNILAINFYGRSGSLFLQSLFDGHPNTITTAGVFFYFLLDFYDKNSSLEREELIEKFSSSFAAIFDSRLQTWCGWTDNNREEYGLTRMGPEQNQHLSLDKEKFLNAVDEIFNEHPGPLTRKMFFQTIHLAYHLGLDRNLPQDRNLLIVFPNHNLPPKQSAKFSQDFPNTKYILTIREPLATLDSLLKHAKEEPAGAVLKHILLDGTAKPGTDNSRALRIEDLNQEPEKMLHKICQWLNIPWHESLLSSTFHGLTWWGDKSSFPRTGFSTNNNSQPKQYSTLSTIDQLRLRVLLWAKYKAWNYPLPNYYQTLSARLLTLLLLPLPFKVEHSNALRTRQKILKAYSQTKLSARLTFRLFIYRFFIFIPIDYLKLRVDLLIAWLRLFYPKDAVVPLI
ncbi:MAG: sulfotransferase [Candidatus Obscuribacterales bacterium]|nr:sulfotransferase [Candidatus Obscuribacterales bacterium]